MQRLLSRVPWDADAARDRLQQFVIERFGDEEGIGVIDETSFLKSGSGLVEAIPSNVPSDDTLVPGLAPS